MPVIELDGQLHEFPDDFTDADIAAALESIAPAPTPTGPQAQSTTGLPETMVGLRAAGTVAPAVGRGAARFVANHPAGVQKAISVGMTGLGGTLGGVLGSGFGPTGGIVGALTGAAAKGLTPTQANIREWAGRGMGEAPEVAKSAGRAQGIQEYIKKTSGLKVEPAHILERAKGLPAGEAYAESQGRELLKILGPDEKVVLGPTAPATPKPPSTTGRLITRGAGAAKTGLSAVGKALNAVSGPIAMTDLAQTIEPTRQDIGVMGIGKSVDVPGMHPTAFEQLRQAILSRLGY